MADKEQQEYEAAFAQATDNEAGDTSPLNDREPDNEAADPNLEEAGADTPPEDSETNQPEEIDWNNPDAARAAFEAAKRERDELDHKLRSDAGRVTRYQRDRDEALRKVELLTNAARQEDLDAIIQSDDWKKAKEEYGDDLATIFRAFEVMAEQGKTTQERFSQMGEDELRGFVASNVETLNEKASDWLDLISHQDFDPWLQRQPAYVQRFYENNREVLVDPDEVLDLVGRFRSYANAQQQNSNPAETDLQTQSTDQRRAAQLEGSRSAKAKRPSISGGPASDYEGYFRQAAAAEERAMFQR